MANNNQKNIFIRILLSWYFFPLILICIIILGGIFLNKYDENKAVDNDLEMLKKQIEELEKSNDDLTSLINYFDSNFFVEKEAREKMGLKKEGEKVVVVKEKEYNSISSSNQDNTLDKQGSEFLPLVWWDYFFNK